MLNALLLAMQITVVGAASGDVWLFPNHSGPDDLMHKLVAEMTIDANAGPAWLELYGSFTRWSGYTDNLGAFDGSPVNHGTARFFVSNWGARGGLQFAGCRAGARFARRDAWRLGANAGHLGPRWAIPADPTDADRGYYAVIDLYADCQVGPVVVRGWGYELDVHGKTLPWSDVTIEPVVRLGAWEVGGRIEFSYGEEAPIIDHDGRVIAYRQMQPLVGDVSIGRWWGDRFFTSVKAGSGNHPGWAERYSRVAIGIAVATNGFRDRQRSIGVYR